MPDVSIYIRNTADSAFSLADFTPDVFNQLLLNFQIADIKDPSQAKGDFSYTIKLPATANNNIIFGHAYENTIYSSEQVVKLTRDAFIEADGVRVFSGKVRVHTVSTISGKPLAYECIFFGTNATWSDALSTKYLADLDFGSHFFDVAQIEASWTGDPDSIDFVYPYISYGAAAQQSYATVEDMRPALYVRNIIQKALHLAGFSLQSDFLNSAIGKALILPYFGTFSNPDSYIDDNAIKVAKDTDQTVTTTEAAINFPLETTPYYDNAGQWSTDTFTAANTGSYDINLNIQVKQPGSGVGALPKIWIEVNGVFVRYLDNLSKPLNGSFGLLTFNKAESISSQYTGLILNAGDDLQIKASTESGTNTFDILTQSTSSDGSTLEIYPSTTAIERGDSVTLSDVLDKTDMPLSEFILDILKIFNLYALTNYDSRIVYIEPRDTFFLDKAYSADWTQKIDISKEITSNTLLDSYTRDIRLRFADDSSDGLVSAWQDNSHYPYLSYLHTLPDGFQKGQTEIATQHIAPTMMGKCLVTGAAVPLLWTDAAEPGDAASFSTDFAPRLLFYAGVQSALTFKWEDADTSVGLPMCYSINPLLDNSGQSICFDNHSDLNTTFTEKGLYQNYYASMLDAVAYGSLLSCKAYLTATDIASLMDDGNKRPLWRKLIWVKDSYYTINSISNYNPLSNGLCDIQLLQYFPPTSKAVTKRRKVIHTIKDNPGFPVIKKNVDIVVPSQLPLKWDGHVETGANGGSAVIMAAVLNNGTGNAAQPGTAAVVMAQGGVGVAAQFVAGSYNDPDSDALFQVGNGTGDDNRSNAFEVTDDGAGNVKAFINGHEIVTSGGGSASYTFSTGLTESSGTVTANLSTGKAGGQTVKGGTAASENLLLQSTTNAVKGYVGVTDAAPGVSTRPLFALGSGGFAGAANNFSGNGSGTILGINAASGYAGDLVNFQKAGTSGFKVKNTGDIVIGNDSSTSNNYIRTNGGNAVLEVNLSSPSNTSLVISDRGTQGMYFSTLQTYLGHNVAITGGSTGTLTFAAHTFSGSSGGSVLGANPSLNGTQKFMLLNGRTNANANNDILYELYLNTTLDSNAKTGITKYGIYQATTDRGNYLYQLTLANNLTMADGSVINIGVSSGTVIGQPTSKMAFYGAPPVVQSTTAAAASAVVPGGGTPLTDTDLYDGYTLAQVVKALRNIGILQ